MSKYEIIIIEGIFIDLYIGRPDSESITFFLAFRIFHTLLLLLYYYLLYSLKVTW